jgi:hypothetical protein
VEVVKASAGGLCQPPGGCVEVVEASTGGLRQPPGGLVVVLIGLQYSYMVLTFLEVREHEPGGQKSGDK